MKSPLELAARAICVEFGVDPDHVITTEDDFHVEIGLRQPHPTWTRYVGMARATLLAARDPNEAMIAAADALPCSISATACWQTMIDAVLADQPKGTT